MSRTYQNRDNCVNIVLVPAKEANNNISKINSLVTDQRTTIQSTNLNSGAQNATAQGFSQYHGLYAQESTQQANYNNFNVTHLGTPLHCQSSESQSPYTYYWNPEYNVTNPAYMPDVSLQNTDPNVLNNLWYPQGQATDIYQNNYINNTYYPVRNEYYDYVTPYYSECCQPITNINQNPQASTANQHGFYTPATINENITQINSQHTHHLQQNYNNTPPKISVRTELVPLSLNVKENIATAVIKLPEYEMTEQPAPKINNETKIKEEIIKKNPIKISLKQDATDTKIKKFLDSIKFTAPKNDSDSKIKIPNVQPTNNDTTRSENLYKNQEKAIKRVLYPSASDETLHSERKKYKKISETHTHHNVHSNENRENISKRKERIPEKNNYTKTNHNRHEKFKKSDKITATKDIIQKSDKITATKDIIHKNDSSRSANNKILNENNIKKLIEKNKVETLQKTNRRQELLREIQRLEEKLRQVRKININSPMKEKSDIEKKKSRTKENTNNSDANSKKEKCKLKSVVKVSNVFNIASKAHKKEYVHHKNKYYIIKNDDTTIINTSKYYEPSSKSYKTSDEKRVKEKHSTDVKLKYNTKLDKFRKRDQLTITVSTRNDETDDESTETRNVKLIDKLKKTKLNTYHDVNVSTTLTQNKVKNSKIEEVQIEETDPMDLDTSFLDDINVDEIVESLNFLNGELQTFDSENNNTYLNCIPITEISKSVNINTNPDGENNNNVISLKPILSPVDTFSENNSLIYLDSKCISSSIITSPVNFNPDLPVDLTTSRKKLDIKNVYPAPKPMEPIEEIELELKKFFESCESEDDELNNVNTIDLSSKFILSKNVVHNFPKPNTISQVPYPDISKTKGISITSNDYLNNASPYSITERNDSDLNYRIETKSQSQLSSFIDIMTVSNYSQDEIKPILITDENKEPPTNTVINKTYSQDKLVDLSRNITNGNETTAFGNFGNELKVNSNAHQIIDEVASKEEHSDFKKNKDDYKTSAVDDSGNTLKLNIIEVDTPVSVNRKLEENQDGENTLASNDSGDKLKLNKLTNVATSPVIKEHDSEKDKDDLKTLAFDDSANILTLNNNEVDTPVTEERRELAKNKEDQKTLAFDDSCDKLKLNNNANEITNEVATRMSEKHRDLEKNKDDEKPPAFDDSKDKLKPNNNAHEVVSPVTDVHLQLEKNNNSINNCITTQNDICNESIATDLLLDISEQDDLEALEEGLEIPKNVVNELSTLTQMCDEVSNISVPLINSAETESKNTNILDLTTCKIQASDISNLKTESTVFIDEKNASRSTTITTEAVKSELLLARSTIAAPNTESLPIADKDRERIESRVSSILKSTCSVDKFIHQGKFSKIYTIRKQCGENIIAKVSRYNYNWKEKIKKEKKFFEMQEDIPREKYSCVWLYNGLGIDESWCFLMEYFPKNLDQALVENKKPFSIELIQRLARQLVTAAFIVRNNSIVHTDISPRHILLSASNETLKLCGFDECHPIDHSDITPMIGSSRYRAPEVILGHSAGPSIDVWATALVLYKMATKIDMFTATTNNRLLYQQMLKFGMVPKHMMATSKFRSAHFNKNKFIKKSITKGEFGMEKHFKEYEEMKPNKKWQILMHKYYFKLYPKIPSTEALLRRFIVMLSKMLVIDVKERLAIEFVCIEKFIH